ncbi:MAG: hypothetical protein NVS4B4_19220 [Bradyrhizobium sp.]
MASYLYRMPSGIPGALNRAEHATVEAGLPLVGFLPAGFGLPLAVDAATGRYRAILAADPATAVVGVLVRPYPLSSLGTTSDGLGTITNFASYAGIINVMRRGYVNVLIGGVIAAAKQGLVYIRVATPSAGKPLFGFEAAADGANTIVMPNSWYWMGPSDAQGNSELCVNI